MPLKSPYSEKSFWNFRQNATIVTSGVWRGWLFSYVSRRKFPEIFVKTALSWPVVSEERNFSKKFHGIFPKRLPDVHWSVEEKFSQIFVNWHFKSAVEKWRENFSKNFTKTDFFSSVEKWRGKISQYSAKTQIESAVVKWKEQINMKVQKIPQTLKDLEKFYY